MVVSFGMRVLSMASASRALWGIAAIATALGSRHVLTDLTKAQTDILSSPLVKRFVVVCVVFSATRDLITSLAMGFAVNVVLEHLGNEHSPYNLLKVVGGDSARKDHTGAPAPEYAQHAPPPVMRAVSSGAGHAIETAMDAMWPLLQ